MPKEPFKIVVHVPEEGMKEYDLSRPETVLGRDPASDVPLDDKKVSRAHARIAFRAGKYSLRDLGSRNGTHLNGRKLTAEDGEISVGDGDRIRLGRHGVRNRRSHWNNLRVGRTRGDIQGRLYRGDRGA